MSGLCLSHVDVMGALLNLPQAINTAINAKTIFGPKGPRLNTRCRNETLPVVNHLDPANLSG